MSEVQLLKHQRLMLDVDNGNRVHLGPRGSLPYQLVVPKLVVV